ncbi:hypothetical protein GQ53DRAFT_828123 [Thozetella sp. PMI_491]|nr:hypothetical protein GQ53DRAFT_828123 [Thozetella sp. PMI_491]
MASNSDSQEHAGNAEHQANTGPGQVHFALQTGHFDSGGLQFSWTMDAPTANTGPGQVHSALQTGHFDSGGHQFSWTMNTPAANSTQTNDESDIEEDDQANIESDSDEDDQTAAPAQANIESVNDEAEQPHALLQAYVDPLSFGPAPPVLNYNRDHPIAAELTRAWYHIDRSAMTEDQFSAIVNDMLATYDPTVQPTRQGWYRKAETAKKAERQLTISEMEIIRSFNRGVVPNLVAPVFSRTAHGKKWLDIQKRADDKKKTRVQRKSAARTKPKVARKSAKPKVVRKRADLGCGPVQPRSGQDDDHDLGPGMGGGPGGAIGAMVA